MTASVPLRLQDLKKCNFEPIYTWHMAEREKKKNLSKEVRSQLPLQRASCCCAGWPTLLCWCRS